MVRLAYCTTGNPLGETGERFFNSLGDALAFIEANRDGLLADSAG